MFKNGYRSVLRLNGKHCFNKMDENLLKNVLFQTATLFMLLIVMYIPFLLSDG